MAALTEQLATILKYICSCNVTQDHITNGRWVCDPRDPKTVLFRADITGTGNIDSSTLANDVGQWAEQTSSVQLGAETLPIQGAMQCEDENCIASPAGPSNLWIIIGVVAGILVLLFIIVVAVAAVIIVRWKVSRKRSFRLVRQFCLPYIKMLQYEASNVKTFCNRFIALKIP